MKQILRGLLTILLLTSFAIQAGSGGACYDCDKECNTCCLGPCDGSPFLLPRSQGRNAARDLIGWQQFINKCGMEDTYGDFAITLEYNRSMRPENILQFYFGDQLATCNGLLVQGTQVDSRNHKAWVADYFGLPTDFESLVTFEPRVENFTVDLQFYIGLDNFLEGTYLRIQTPLVHTKWSLNMTECIKNIERNDYVAGYMSEETIDSTTLPRNFTSVMLGKTTFGDMKEPLKYGLFPICPIKKTRLADIRTSLGWNFFQTDDHHVGTFLQVVFPTGTRPNACHLFEPIIGNGKHFELGLGFTSSYIFWRSEEHCDRYLGLWFDATLTHLFNSCQRRSFDFCGKPNSRYMLLEQMKPAETAAIDLGNEETIDRVLAGENGQTESMYQYAGKLIPAINWSTLNVDVKINVQADMVLTFGYVRDNWNFDLGYNFWARTGEKFTYCKPCGMQKKYAAKGEAFLYGKIAIEEPSVITDPLPTAQSFSRARVNCVGIIDNPNNAIYADPNNLATNEPLQKIEDGTNLGDQLQVSLPPVFVSRDDLNMDETPSAITHKLFWHFNHTWKDRDERWLPFLGLGGAIEWDHCSDVNCCGNCGNSTSNCCGSSCVNASTNAFGGNCNTCCLDRKTKRGGISQWGVWIKGGIYFE